MDKIYEVLEGKIIDAGELVSMMKAQTDGEGKCVKDFAERIIDLIVSHAHKTPEKVDVFNLDVLNTDAPPENRYFANSNDNKFFIKGNTNIDKGFNITVKGSENIDRGMSITPDRIK